MAVVAALLGAPKIGDITLPPFVDHLAEIGWDVA